MPNIRRLKENMKVSKMFEIFRYLDGNLVLYVSTSSSNKAQIVTYVVACFPECLDNLVFMHKFPANDIIQFLDVQLCKSCMLEILPSGEKDTYSYRSALAH